MRFERAELIQLVLNKNFGHPIGYNRVRESGMEEPKIEISQEILKLIAEIDHFKGSWDALRNLAPERLANLKHVATIESIASSTRIEGANLTDREVDQLLSRIPHKSFKTRDEQDHRLV